MSPAGRWLLHSGIRRPSRGFARYYDANCSRNRAVSTEISAYAASALVWLFDVTGEDEYLTAARETGEFLLEAWDPDLRTFPFEHPSPSPESEHLSYFFDCGIIVRGLLAVWHRTADGRFLDLAKCGAHGMVRDFEEHPEFHPILTLPHKEPLGRTGQWSRNPGSYQLKAALGWRDLATITGDAVLQNAWRRILDFAVEGASDFLPGDECVETVMDRLHPFCYFLEGLIPELGNEDVQFIYARGLESVARYLREIAPTFARSDVYAQLLRARLYAGSVIRVDEKSAAQEAAALARFQLHSEDVRTDGGFVFGARSGSLIQHVNPVSTVFGIQALDMWHSYETTGSKQPCLRLLI